MKPDLESVLRAIRAKCLDCSGNQKKLVENCTIKDCPLMPYRSIQAMKDPPPPPVDKNQISISRKRKLHTRRETSMWDDFFHEPTVFEEQVEEFKESLRAAVRGEITQEMDRLRKENESLRAIRDDWNGKVRELEQDYSKKKSELDDAIRKARYAESEAKELRFNELVAEVAPVVWSIEYRTIHLPKCDLCDEHRYRQYTTPLGRISKEPCTCAATKEQAYAKRVPILKIYGLDRQNELRPYYLTCDDEYATYRDSYEFFDDTPFEEISRWRRPLFHDEHRARRYAAWHNQKEGLT